MSSNPTDEARLAVIEARLGNGQRSFEDLQKRLADVETQTRPNLSRIATWLAGVLMTVGSLVWSGAMMAAERPTFAQTKEIATNTRAEQAHEATQKHLEEQKAEMQRHQEVLTTLSLQMQMVLKGITNIEEKMERQRR